MFAKITNLSFTFFPSALGGPHTLERRASNSQNSGSSCESERSHTHTAIFAIRFDTDLTNLLSSQLLPEQVRRSPSALIALLGTSAFPLSTPTIRVDCAAYYTPKLYQTVCVLYCCVCALLSFDI